MKLDYWMYSILREILNKRLNEVTKTYKPAAYAAFKENRFHEIGKVYLIRQKLEEMHELHDKEVKEALEIMEEE